TVIVGTSVALASIREGPSPSMVESSVTTRVPDVSVSVAAAREMVAPTPALSRSASEKRYTNPLSPVWTAVVLTGSATIVAGRPSGSVGDRPSSQAAIASRSADAYVNFTSHSSLHLRRRRTEANGKRHSSPARGQTLRQNGLTHRWCGEGATRGVSERSLCRENNRGSGVVPCHDDGKNFACGLRAVKFLFPDGSYDVSAHVAAGFVRFAAAYLRSGFVCAVLMCLASPVHAQEEVGSVYVAAGISFPNQLPKESGSPPPFSAPAGATVGWSIGAGIFVHPRISLEGELSTTGVMRRDEGGRHDLRAVAQRKDRFVSLAVKGHLEVRSAVRVEPLGGLV